MNLDFIVDGLENFAAWGSPIADIFEALGDIFGALDDLGTDGGENDNEGSGLGELSSNLSSSDGGDGNGEVDGGDGNGEVDAS